MEKDKLVEIIRSNAVTYITLTVCIIVFIHYVNGLLHDNGVLPKLRKENE